MKRIMLALTVVCVAVTTFAVAEDTEDSLKKKFEKRNDDVVKAKNDGKVGETSEGYLEAIKEETLKKDKALKTLIEEENKDRKALYKLVAKRQSTEKEKMTIEAVAKAAVKVKFEKAGDKEYFKGKDGKWRTKAEMVEAMKKAKKEAAKKEAAKKDEKKETKKQ